MKIENLTKEEKEALIRDLNEAEDKGAAILQAIEKFNENEHESMIQELLEESARAEADADYKRSLNLANLSEEEKKFYEVMKDPKQAITAAQIDIIPTSIIDRTLDDVKKATNILTLVNMAPANVQRWITASHTGKAAWGELLSTEEITAELSATITYMNIEQNTLLVFMVIPKAIGKLSLEYVDKYFRAILAEAMQDGLVDGYLNGNGKNAPIGIMNQINKTSGGGEHTAKTAVAITSFSPKSLAPIRKTLSNDGKRVVSELALICNPSDEAEYVDPALFGLMPTGAYGNTSFTKITKYPDANCPKGKGVITMPGVYTMGVTGVEVKQYDQTLAMQNADLIIGSAYGNGRAIDDNCAVVIDVTKLEEYVPVWKDASVTSEQIAQAVAAGVAQAATQSSK